LTYTLKTADMNHSFRTMRQENTSQFMMNSRYVFSTNYVYIRLGLLGNEKQEISLSEQFQNQIEKF